MASLNKPAIFTTKYFLGAIMFFLISLPFYAIGFTIENFSGIKANNDFVVGPGKIELEIKPGTSNTVYITVTNRLGYDSVFNVEVEDFTASKNISETVMILGEEHGPYSLKDYLSPEKTNFELKGGQKATIAITVSIPADSSPGGRYGSVIVGAAPKSNTLPQGGNAIIPRAGVLFFVKVPGEVTESGILKTFGTIGNKKVYDEGPVKFQLLYENTGNIHVSPYGEIKILNSFFREIDRVEVDPWFALPDSLRLREIHWNKNFLLGKYTAVASINRGYGDIIDEAKFTFWVIPKKITLVLGVVAGILIILIGIAIFKKKVFFRKKYRG